MVGDERREEGRPIETKTVPIGEQSGIPGSLPVHGQNTGSQCSDCLRHETVVRQRSEQVTKHGEVEGIDRILGQVRAEADLGDYRAL
jgi:hypothetical protein